jgi:hypothetical protein
MTFNEHHSFTLTSSALDHSTTSTPKKRSYNNRSVTLSRKANLEIDTLTSNSITAWFNLQRYIYIHIYIKSKGIYQPENLMSNGSSRRDDAAQTKYIIEV